MKMVKLIQSVLVALLAVMLIGCSDDAGTTKKEVGVKFFYESTTPKKVDPAKKVMPSTEQKVQPKAEQKPAKKAGVAYLPMAQKGEISSPKVLAERVRESLKKDSNGKTLVRGAYATPHDFLVAVQKAGGKVEGLSALPAYLDALVEGDMPEGTITMSRIKASVAVSGSKKYELDVATGFPREARKGERGWYDANTGLLILAGDCSNSPLKPTKGPSVPAVVTPPTKVTSAPAVQTQCTKPTYWRVRVWEKKAAQVAGVPELLKVKSPSVADSSHYDADDLSRYFGDTYLELEKKGLLSLDGGQHAVIVNHLKSNGTVVKLYEGVVTGMYTGNLPEDFRTGESLQVQFKDLTMFVSPRSDIRARHSEFKKCTTAIHAIVK